MIGEESHKEVDDGEYAITGGTAGRNGSGVTAALVWEVVGAWRLGDPFAFGGVEHAATRGACRGREADFGNGGGVVLRELADYKGQELIDGVLDVVRRFKPLHLSIVGGEPLVRFRELDVLLPKLTGMGVHTQVVTSAVRPIPESWANMERLQVCVSIDGLQPEHDQRRKPATYERILKSIVGSSVTVHCTVTAQMMQRDGYLEEFLRFWSARPEIKRVWMSVFTPQKGATDPEILNPAERERLVGELLRLRELYPVLDMKAAVIRELQRPPQSPEEAHEPVQLVEDPKVVLPTDRIEARLCHRFGFTFRAVNVGPDEALAVSVRSQHPAILRPDGTVSAGSTYPLSVTPDRNGLVGFSFDEPWELVPGTWTFQVLLGDKVLAECVFHVVPPESAQPAVPGGCQALVS